jgi:hypothetical protein
MNTKEARSWMHIEAGLLVRRQVRNQLIQWKYVGEIDDFNETKGFLGSLFYVKGPISFLERIQAISQ